MNLARQVNLRPAPCLAMRAGSQAGRQSRLTGSPNVMCEPPVSRHWHSRPVAPLVTLLRLLDSIFLQDLDGFYAVTGHRDDIESTALSTRSRA